MLYDEARMALTKERLEDLRKEKKLSFEQLSKQLAERGVNISHTNLKHYEITDPIHPLYGRTRSMSIEYLTAFADFYDVSVEYLLGLSNSRKKEYFVPRAGRLAGVSGAAGLEGRKSGKDSLHPYPSGSQLGQCGGQFSLYQGKGFGVCQGTAGGVYLPGGFL